MCSLLLPLSDQLHSPLPEELLPYLTILSTPPGLPICLSCQTAVLPKSLIDHFRKQHNLPPKFRTLLRTLVSTLPVIDDLTPRDSGSVPVPELRIVEAYQCSRCSFIRRDLTDVRKHINKDHDASATGSYEQIQAQSWLGGRRADYWRVQTGIEGQMCAERQAMLSYEAFEECRFGLLGKGFGIKTPKEWPKEVIERARDEVDKQSPMHRESTHM